MAAKIKISAQQPDEKIIAQAAAAIRAGSLVIFPTETCYGLAADATSKVAVKKVYAAKGPLEKSPTSIIVANLKMAGKYCELTYQEQTVAEKLMPGPITLVVKKKATLPDNLTRGLPTVGFRISSSPIAAALAKKAGVPITATSANIHGEGEKYAIEEMSREFLAHIDLILDAGPLAKIKPSTVAQIVGDKIKILRQGPITKEQVEAALK